MADMQGLMERRFFGDVEAFSRANCGEALPPPPTVAKQKQNAQAQAFPPAVSLEGSKQVRIASD
jgi:hypothetical protein